MNEPAASAEVYLKPGDFHFGAETVRIHTLLGSCVAITLWHPVFHIGGMCHFMLPSRERQEGGRLDGRYGDEAVQLFLREIGKFNTRPVEYQAKLFGGGNMFTDFTSRTVPSVAQRNAEAGLSLLRQNGFHLESVDVGGNGHRRVIFDLRDGNVWVRHEKPTVKSAA
jgi:chemotaxis protein CheD